MDDRTLGHLERVDPATVWKSEPGEFVPWLAAPENLCRLGNALRLDLEPVARETAVGRFRADLVCRDRVTGAAVVIEAQLGPTDHTHLGQLLTYAVGLGSRTVVWLATRFHGEHRAVLDRLNRPGGADLRCFAVKMDLWKIDASRTAPQFTVFAGPGDWFRFAANTTGDGPVAPGEASFPADAGDLGPFDENPIRVRRKGNGMTVKQLAKAVGISAAYMSDIETGRRLGSPATRAAIAKALDAALGDPTRSGPPHATRPGPGNQRRTAE